MTYSVAICKHQPLAMSRSKSPFPLLCPVYAYIHCCYYLSNFLYFIEPFPIQEAHVTTYAPLAGGEQSKIFCPQLLRFSSQRKTKSSQPSRPVQQSWRQSTKPCPRRTPGNKTRPIWSRRTWKWKNSSLRPTIPPTAKRTRKTSRNRNRQPPRRRSNCPLE